MAESRPSGPRPEVWVNVAASADGRIAFAEGVRARLSSPADLARVQRLRSQVDGILVGVGTVLRDDPSLRVHWELLEGPRGTDPARIVVDGSGRTPDTARVLDGSIPTIIVTTEGSRRKYPAHVRTVAAGTSRVDLARAFAKLSELGIGRLLVEGGSEILSSVLRGSLFDRLSIYYAPVLIGADRGPPIVAGPAARSFDEVVALELTGLERAEEGYIATYVPRPPGGSGARTAGRASLF